MDDEADQRNQPAENNDQSAIGRIAPGRVLHDPDRDPEPKGEADEHGNQRSDPASGHEAGCLRVR